MKAKHILFLVFFITITLSSCRLLNFTGGSFLTATVDDEEFISLNLLTTFVEVDSSFVTITGNTGGVKSQSIIFNLNNYEGKGTYEFGENSLNFATYAAGNSVSELFSTANQGSSGSLELEVISETIAEGTFSFIATHEDENGEMISVSITDGEFGIERN